MFVRKMYKDMFISYCIALSCLLLTPFVNDRNGIEIFTILAGIVWFCCRYVYIGFKWKAAAVSQYRNKVKKDWWMYLGLYLFITIVICEMVAIQFR